MKKKHIFIRNRNTGEPAYYCGEVGKDDELRKAITNIVIGELDYMLCGESDHEIIEFHVREMTDEQVESLPEV
jgi:hypothetical protein